MRHFCATELSAAPFSIRHHAMNSDILQINVLNNQKSVAKCRNSSKNTMKNAQTAPVFWFEADVGL